MNRSNKTSVRQEKLKNFCWIEGEDFNLFCECVIDIVSGGTTISAAVRYLAGRAGHQCEYTGEHLPKCFEKANRNWFGTRMVRYPELRDRLQEARAVGLMIALDETEQLLQENLTDARQNRGMGYEPLTAVKMIVDQRKWEAKALMRGVYGDNKKADGEDDGIPQVSIVTNGQNQGG